MTGFYRQYYLLPHPTNWLYLDNLDDMSISTRCLKQRMLLHQVKVLETEIEILKPTIIVFFGWHWVSLEKELSEEVYTKVYGQYFGNEREPILLNNMVFSLHPNDRKHGGRTIAYEEKVLEQVRKLLQN